MSLWCRSHRPHDLARGVRAKAGVPASCLCAKSRLCNGEAPPSVNAFGPCRPHTHTNQQQWDQPVKSTAMQTTDSNSTVPVQNLPPAPWLLPPAFAAKSKVVHLKREARPQGHGIARPKCPMPSPATAPERCLPAASGCSKGQHQPIPLGLPDKPRPVDSLGDSPWTTTARRPGFCLERRGWRP